MFVGVDAFRGGWVSIAITDSGFREARRFARFDALVAYAATAEVIAVDMPVALVEKGDRQADRAARVFLRGRSSSVFTAPPRPILTTRDYHEAQEVSLRLSGKGISKQSFALLPKILEVREHLDDARIHEVHPEVSFGLLAGGKPLGRKKSWGGLRSRLRLLASVGIDLPDDLGEVNRVGIDDVVDAAVAAWSARRIARGDARSFPRHLEERDASGRWVAIWG